MVDFWYRSVNKLTPPFGRRAAKLCHCFLWSTVSASSWYSLPSGSHCVYIDTAILFAVSLVTSWSSNSAKYSPGQSIVHDVKIMQSVQVICCPRSCPVWSMQSKIMLARGRLSMAGITQSTQRLAVGPEVWVLVELSQNSVRGVLRLWSILEC